MIPVLLLKTLNNNTKIKSNKPLCALVLPKNKTQSLINKVVEKSTYTLITQ